MDKMELFTVNLVKKNEIEIDLHEELTTDNLRDLCIKILQLLGDEINE